MKYAIDWSKDAGEEFVEIISWYKYNIGKKCRAKYILKNQFENKEAERRAWHWQTGANIKGYWRERV
jgi:hypothetical protein